MQIKQYSQRHTEQSHGSSSDIQNMFQINFSIQSTTYLFNKQIRKSNQDILS